MKVCIYLFILFNDDGDDDNDDDDDDLMFVTSKNLGYLRMQNHRLDSRLE